MNHSTQPHKKKHVFHVFPVYSGVIPYESGRVVEDCLNRAMNNDTKTVIRKFMNKFCVYFTSMVHFETFERNTFTKNIVRLFCDDFRRRIYANYEQRFKDLSIFMEWSFVDNVISTRYKIWERGEYFSQDERRLIYAVQ